MKSPVNASHQLAPAVSTVEISRICLWPEHVAELGEERHDDRREQQLGGLEPVEVRVLDAEVLDQIGDERHVEALQDAAGQLDEEQPADETERDAPTARCVRGGHERMLVARR